MGGCVSVQVSCDQVLNHLGSCFCRKFEYIHDLKKNLTALERAVEDLKALRADLLRKVQTAEEGGLQRLHQIKVWLKRVKFIESQFNDLSSSKTVELQRLWFYGAASKSLRLSYSYGKRIVLMLNEVEDLKSRGTFEEVAHPATRAVGEERPLQPMIVGQETILEKAWTRLMDDQTKIMGLYGMGGVGKTTLLTQINNKFCDTDDGVENVIWVMVSGDLQIHKIQKEIGEKIGFKDVEWNKKTENQKAVDILNFLSKKRFVLLLDDIWERVDLTKIGIPNPTSENGCKIAFTTRSLCVCSSMGVHDPIEVRCLGPDDAWDLFRKKVGEITLGNHPDIPEIARKVARACRGLPLALNVIGETMACKKTTQEWDHAVDVLTTYAAKFGAVKDKILPILKYSYDNLKSNSVKSCFLYCSLFPEDDLIEKERLIDYWICEGFIDEYESIKQAVDQGHVILGTLLYASLLEEGGRFHNKSYVKMHDVVREMALWIASDLQKPKGISMYQPVLG